MKKYIQIYLGGAKGRGIKIQYIQKKIDIYIDKIDGIIVGWSLEIEIYKWLSEYTKNRHVKLYLWFPVLAEFDKIKNFVAIKDVENERINSNKFDQDENFSFYCPSATTTFENIKNIYKIYFSQIEFDGIFLDRIRFPSFTIGANALFTCCCNECMKVYESRGWTRERIRKIKYEVEHSETKTLPIEIRKYFDGRYEFKKAEMGEYLEDRMKLITAIVRKTAFYFKSQGLEIGLDLFAPFLAPFVGQDYRELSQCADFIKPMLYRCTYTPAGFDYELDEMVRNTSLKADPMICTDSYRRTIGYSKNNSADFMKREIETAKKLSACKVLAGIEIHTINSLPSIKPEQIEEGIKVAEKAGVEGSVASWNILQADAKNLSTFLRRCEE